MTQHPFEFDPNRTEKEFDSLSDTWSRADALLEELPKARKRKESRLAVDGSPAPDEYADTTACDVESSEPADRAQQALRIPLKGLRSKP